MALGVARAKEEQARELERITAELYRAVRAQQAAAAEAQQQKHNNPGTPGIWKKLVQAKDRQLQQMDAEMGALRGQLSAAAVSGRLDLPEGWESLPCFFNRQQGVASWDHPCVPPSVGPSAKKLAFSSIPDPPTPAPGDPQTPYHQIVFEPAGPRGSAAGRPVRRSLDHPADDPPPAAAPGLSHEARAALADVAASLAASQANLPAAGPHPLPGLAAAGPGKQTADAAWHAGEENVAPYDRAPGGAKRLSFASPVQTPERATPGSPSAALGGMPAPRLVR